MLASLLLFISLVVGGGGWYYADALKDGALAVDHEPDELDLIVAAVDDETITLRSTPEAEDDGDWTRGGIFGLEWPGGYAQVGDILEIGEDEVVREFAAGQQRPQVGALARLDSFAFSGDPQEARGLAYQDVAYASLLGEFPAWFLEGSSDIWAIFVHGKGADREEALRMLPAVSEAGLPCLVIAYRNDEGAPQDPDGFYRYGATEWRDLEGAVQYALDHGARRVILVGYSMGGGIVASFLYRSALSGHVAAVILDAPVLNLEATVDWGARDRFVPWPLKDVGKEIAGARYDIDWGELDYLRRAGELAAPVLLFHGDADEKVPVATSAELAELRPDLVEYIRTPGAGHVRSWNADPEAYEAAVREFLLRELP